MRLSRNLQMEISKMMPSHAYANSVSLCGRKGGQVSTQYKQGTVLDNTDWLEYAV
jgi:hypothetical protein